MIQLMAMLLYRPSTPPMALKSSSSISISAISVLNTTHTTRPGWLCVTRAKKLLQAREPAYAFVTLILSWLTTTSSTVALSAQPYCEKTIS